MQRFTVMALHVFHYCQSLRLGNNADWSNPDKKSENNADDNNPYFNADSNNPDNLCKLWSFKKNKVGN